MSFTPTKTAEHYNGMRNTVGAFHRLHMEYLRNIINSDVDTEALKITSVMSEYKVAINALQKWINATKGFEDTVSVTAADNFRDKLMTYITTSIRYARMLPKESQLYAAAQKLAPVLSPYKGVPRHEINKETAEITGLLQQLAPEAMKQAVATMGLTQAVKELDEQNKSIQDAIDKRKSEKAIRIEDRGELSPDELRKYICQIYDELLLHINAGAVNGVEGVAALVTKMNVTAKDFLNIALTHEGRLKANASGKDSDPDTPSDDPDDEPSDDPTPDPDPTPSDSDDSETPESKNE